MNALVTVKKQIVLYENRELKELSSFYKSAVYLTCPAGFSSKKVLFTKEVVKTEKNPEAAWEEKPGHSKEEKCGTS